MNSIICNNLNLFGRFFESKYLFPENVQDFDIRINEDYLSLHALSRERIYPNGKQIYVALSLIESRIENWRIIVNSSKGIIFAQE